MAAPPERLTSRFDVSHGMLLNVLSRRGDGCRAMQALIRDSHETDHAKKAHFKRGLAALPRPGGRAASSRSCRAREEGSRVRVNVDLQEDFSMNQALSLYLFETIPLLDAESETLRARPAHPGREHPREPGADPAPAARQAEGPQGRGDEGGGARLRPAHGRAGEDGVPEAAARLRLHDLQRLRRPPSLGGRGEHPAQVDRARDVRGLPLVLRLRAGVRPRARGGPAAAAPQQRLQGAERRPCPTRVKTDADPRDGAVPARHAAPGGLEPARGVGADARSVATWRPGAGAEMRPPRPEEPPDVTRDTKAFTAAIRTRVFAFLRAWSIGRRRGGAGAPRLARRRRRASRGRRRGCAPRARPIAPSTAACASIPRRATCGTPTVTPAEDRASWRVQQMLVDPQGLNDWVAEVDVDLTASRVTGEPVVQLVRLGSLVES